MEKVPVSVVIPCYCCSATVGRAVASVYRQTARPTEVILVDDASPDETYLALLQIQDVYGSDWVRIIRLDNNSGPSLARNTGWDAAQFSYIAFLDADDSWHPNKIEIQYNWMLSKPDVVMSGHHCAVIDSEPDCYSEIEDCTASKIGKYKQLFSNQFSTPSVMVRRSLPFRFPSQRYSEDYMLWCEIVIQGLPVYKLNEILAYLYKPRYGTTGLSGNLWLMELGELKNYKKMYSKKIISLTVLVLLTTYSFVKYCRRHIIARYKSLA